MLRFPVKILALTSAALLLFGGCQMQIINDPTTAGTSATAAPETSKQTAASTIPTTTPVVTPGTTTTPPETNEPATTTPPATTTTAPVTTTTPPTTTAPPTTTTTPAVTWPTPEDKPNPTGKKRVAFSFDDGPHSTLTYKFVDKLKEYGATATFFVVGNRLGKSGGAAIQYVYENGCEIGLHSYTHEPSLYYSKCTEEEYFRDMQQTADAVAKYIPATVTLMRPPGGNITKDRIASCPYAVINWSVDSLDWKYKARGDEATKQKNIEIIVNNVMNQIDDGDIVLMHELYENSYEAFSIIIERLYADGYEVVSVTELLGSSLQAGKLYNYKK